MGDEVSVGAGVWLDVGVKVEVIAKVLVGAEVWVGVGDEVRVGEEVEVGMAVRVAVDEGGSVAVFVWVGVLDKSAAASCTCKVCAALVASALKSFVGDGSGVAVTVDVALGGRVRVGEGVEVAIAGVTKLTLAGSVWVCSNLGDDRVLTGAGVSLREARWVRNEVGVAVGRNTEDEGTA